MQLWVARINEGSIGGLLDAPGKGMESHAGNRQIRRFAEDGTELMWQYEKLVARRSEYLKEVCRE